MASGYDRIAEAIAILATADVPSVTLKWIERECVQAHIKAEKKRRAVAAFLARYKTGKTAEQVARELGVCRRTLYNQVEILCNENEDSCTR